MDVREVLTFLFFSALEWLAMIVLTFAVFKFQLPGYRGRILLTSAVLSFLSYLIFVEFDLNFCAPLVQMPIVFLFFWQYFRIPVFYAWLMNVNGYVLYTLLQAVIIFFVELTGIKVKPNDPAAYIVQSITIFIIFLFAWYLIRTNWGFTFVPDTDRVKMHWTKLNVYLLAISVLGYLALSTYHYLFFSEITPLIGLIAGMAVFGFLQYLVIKREFQ
jgi:hypothetical protein